MIKLQCLVLCCFTIGAFASKVPFINKCAWADKACLTKSSQDALLHFTNGIPELGLEPMEPLTLKAVTLKKDKLHIDFSDMVWVGPSKCVFKHVERNAPEKWLDIHLVCPVDLTGHYVASGHIPPIAIEGDGTFHCKTEEAEFIIRVGLVPYDKDGDSYWKLSCSDIKYSFDFKKKTLLEFLNLFGGDEEKAAPVKKLLDQNTKNLVNDIAPPIIRAVVDKICTNVNNFASQIPTKYLEIL
ncbi:uncharacterized protein LOC142975997 [Anticarsia gemmatalis]|uniref:uncharacterized protein LOC142975997 n=1 Tax=Anticarsia gemmatalis TaxID=129554 RepID=UPI003F7782FA